MKVFVNPGHDPNVDSGAVNIDYDVREADVTKQAGALLERGLKRAGHEVMLLQSDDLDAFSMRDLSEPLGAHPGCTGRVAHSACRIPIVAACAAL